MRRALTVLVLVLFATACEAGDDPGDPTSDEARRERTALRHECFDDVVLSDDCRDIRCLSDADCEQWEYCGPTYQAENGERFCDLRQCMKSWEGDQVVGQYCNPPRWQHCAADLCPMDLVAYWNECATDADCYADAWGDRPDGVGPAE